MSSFLGKISEKYVSLSSQVDVYRNIKGFKFNCMLTFEDEINLYNKICSQFYKLYYSDRFTFEKVNTKKQILKYYILKILPSLYYAPALFLNLKFLFRFQKIP